MPIRQSAMAKRVYTALLPSINEQARQDKLFNDALSIESRRSFRLSRFNIVKLEALHIQPLRELALEVPVERLPFIDLPSARLEELQTVLATFRDDAFEYSEAFYSDNFWYGILLKLFTPPYNIVPEYNLRRIDSDYRGLKTDFVASSSQSRNIPVLSVELGKEPLLGSLFSHKDEEKLAVKLGASLLKIMSYCSGEGRQFLEKLRVYGLLCGATDFDVCVLYPVFTSQDEAIISDFYFVFSTSKHHLRNSILKEEYAPVDSFLCPSTISDFGNLLGLTQPVAVSPVPALTGEIENLTIILDEVESSSDLLGSESESTPTGKNETICQKLFDSGIVNIEALQVLERLTELVVAQFGLIDPVIRRRPEPNDYFRYSPNLKNFMNQGRDNTTSKTPIKRRRLNLSTEIQKPSSPSERALRHSQWAFPPPLDVRFDNLITFLESFDEVPFHGIGTNVSDEKTPPISITKVYKKKSPFEICIYELEAIKNCVLFPTLIESSASRDNENVFWLKLETIEPLSNFSFDLKEENAGELQFIIGRFLLDALTALKVLHSAGYVHGDLSRTNVGYNERLNHWQIYDFDQSRPVIDAAIDPQNGGTKGYRSRYFEETGLFQPCDDYVSVALSCLKGFSYLTSSRAFWAPFRLLLKQLMSGDGIIEPDLDLSYLMAVEMFLKLPGVSPKDPSILTALPFLLEIKSSRQFTLVI